MKQLSFMYLNVQFLSLVLFTLSIEGTNTPKCPFPNGKRPAYFPHEDCGKFWQCSNGIPYLMVCPNETHFNVNNNVCDWPERAGCKEVVTRTTDIPDTTGTTEEDKCLAVNGSNVIYFPDEDCSKYWKCINGFAIARKCPRGLLFSTELQICDWPQNVVCSSETSPASSTSSSITETTTFTSQISPKTTSGISTTADSRIPTASTNPATSSMAQFSSKVSPRPFPSPDQSTTNVERCDFENVSTSDGNLLTTRICKPVVTYITDIPTSFTSEKSEYITSEYDTTSEDDFATTEAIIDLTTDENRQSTSEYIKPSIDSDEDDLASFSDEDEITTTEKVEPVTDLVPRSTADKRKDELIEDVCRNLPDDQFQAAHPFDCSKFLYCDNGYVTIADCAANLWYDPLTRKCEYPNRAQCAIWRYEREVLMNS